LLRSFAGEGKTSPYIQWLSNRLEKYWILRNLWRKV